MPLAKRHLALDTETTGFGAPVRIVEVAAVEFDPDSGAILRRFHVHLNPEREVEAGARALHGLDLRFLRDKPRFADIAGDLRTFLQDGDGYIHNAAYDRRILDEEFGRLALSPLESLVGSVTCTLQMAKRCLPRLDSHKLDALCAHYGIDASARTLHGALLDCELLVEVTRRLLVESAPPPPAPRYPPNVAARPGWCPGGPWLPDEREALVAGFAANTDLGQLAQRHNRSTAAIALQLHKMGMLSTEQIMAMGLRPRSAR